MKKKKMLAFVLCFAALLSVSLNIYCLVPKGHTASISRGYYSSIENNNVPFSFSVMDDKNVVFYDEVQRAHKGTLRFDESANAYLMEIDGHTYQLAVRDDVVFMPVTQNGITVSRLFSRAGSVPVTFEQKGKS